MDSVERITKAAFLAAEIANAAVREATKVSSTFQVDRGLTVAVFQAIMKDVPDALLEDEEDDDEEKKGWRG